MTNLAKIITKHAEKSHREQGVKIDKNQTIVKGQIYGFIGTGYSCGKGRGYCTLTIVKAKTNDYFRVPAHWNREVFEEVDGSGKLHARGYNTAFSRRVESFKREYPGMILV